MSARGALATVVAHVRRGRLLRADDRVLLGLGGGVASAGMLAALLMGREAGLPPCELAVAAVESDLDEEHDGAEVVAEVGRVARSFGLPFFAVRPARTRGAVHIEHELVALARDQGYGRVALATTRDDELRRVLTGLGRGAGLAGLAGYSPRGPGGVVRPLLPLREVEAAALARDLGVEPVQLGPRPGSRELSLEATVLPRWRALEPGLDASLLRVAKEARAVRRMIRAEAAVRLAQAREREGRYRFVVTAVAPGAAPLWLEVSARLLDGVGPRAHPSRGTWERRLARLFRFPAGEVAAARSAPTLVLPGIQADATLTDSTWVVRVTHTLRGPTLRASG
ncbi:MAG: hypothetical protein R3A48_07160 [Polyangiales bacterium]